MKHTLKHSNPELAEISALVDRVRMPEYERLRAQAHLERAIVIADLLARAASGIRAAANALVVRPLHRIRARTA